jgi:hypothetical protein
MQNELDRSHHFKVVLERCGGEGQDPRDGVGPLRAECHDAGAPAGIGIVEHGLAAIGGRRRRVERAVVE